MAPGRRRSAALGLALFALALGVRAAHLLAMRDSLLFDALGGDAAQYDRWAQRIAAGDWLGSEVFYQTPLYPYWMGALYAVFGHDPWIVRIAQSVLGAAACVALARAGARFFGERAGWLAGLLSRSTRRDLLRRHPAEGVARPRDHERTPPRDRRGAVARERAARPRRRARARRAHPEPRERRGARARGPRLGRVAGMAARAGTRARERAARRARPRSRARAGRRAELVGRRRLLLTTSQMGSNFWIGNHRGADGGYVPVREGRGDAQYERDDVRRIAEDAVGHALTPAEVSRWWMARSWDDIRGAPGEWLRLVAWKAYLTANRVELVDGEAVAPTRDTRRCWARSRRVLHFGVLVPLAVLGAWWTRPAVAPHSGSCTR